MASSPHHSWKSAPSLEARDRKKWWNKVFQHSWRRRSRQKRKRSTEPQPPFTPQTQEEHFRAQQGEPIPNFSPFKNQLNLPNFSPTNLGNHLQPQASAIAQDTTSPPTFDPAPTAYKPSRPLLSNVFPMYNTVQVAPQKPVEDQSRTSEDQRRHSTGTTNVEQQSSTQ